MTLRSDEHTQSPEGGDDLAHIAARFSGPLRSFFRKRARDAQDAEDLVQEVFYRLSSRPDGMRHPEAYIFQMAANLLRDRARRHGTRAAADRALSARLGGAVEEISPERVLQGKQRLAALRAALTELPERTRAVFLMQRFEGQKYAQIAAHMGISISAVEKHMMEAMRLLRARVDGA